MREEYVHATAYYERGHGLYLFSTDLLCVLCGLLKIGEWFTMELSVKVSIQIFCILKYNLIIAKQGMRRKKPCTCLHTGKLCKLQCLQCIDTQIEDII